jgi:hypothetical protein
VRSSILDAQMSIACYQYLWLLFSRPRTDGSIGCAGILSGSGKSC